MENILWNTWQYLVDVFDCFLILYLFRKMMRTRLRQPKYYYLFLPVLAAVLFWAVYAAGQHVPAPLCPALRRLAGWCYGVYLVHHVLLTLVFLPFVQGHGLPLAGMFPVYLAASFVPAAVLTAVSRPLGKAIKKLA